MYPHNHSVIDLRNKIRTPVSKTKLLFEELEKTASLISHLPSIKSSEVERWSTPKSDKLLMRGGSSRLQDMRRSATKPYWKCPRKTLDTSLKATPNMKTIGQNRHSFNAFSISDRDLEVDFGNGATSCSEEALAKVTPLVMPEIPVNGFLDASKFNGNESEVYNYVFTFSKPLERGPKAPPPPRPKFKDANVQTITNTVHKCDSSTLTDEPIAPKLPQQQPSLANAQPLTTSLAPSITSGIPSLFTSFNGGQKMSTTSATSAPAATNLFAPEPPTLREPSTVAFPPVTSQQQSSLNNGSNCATSTTGGVSSLFSIPSFGGGQSAPATSGATVAGSMPSLFTSFNSGQQASSSSGALTTSGIPSLFTSFNGGLKTSTSAISIPAAANLFALEPPASRESSTVAFPPVTSQQQSSLNNGSNCTTSTTGGVSSLFSIPSFGGGQQPPAVPGTTMTGGIPSLFTSFNGGQQASSTSGAPVSAAANLFAPEPSTRGSNATATRKLLIAKRNRRKI